MIRQFLIIIALIMMVGQIFKHSDDSTLVETSSATIR